ncbi:MAG: hypothetical protein KDA28_15165 [Phycisphaerales bacterium]|nr:hypothetical protein [Phycisphaerales bacterium]
MSMRFDEKRRDARWRKSDVVLWRLHPREDYRVGWALEGSESGLALAWRGMDAPKVGTVVELAVDGAPANCTQALVRRTDVVHDDLTVIGAEYLTMRPFPPAAAAKVDGYVEPIGRVGYALATG